MENAATVTTPAPVPVEALKFAFEGTTEATTIMILFLYFGVPVLLLICCCWGCVRCVNNLDPLPPAIARRNEIDHNDPEVVHAPYATIEGYVDLNAEPTLPRARVVGTV
jgi:hypothetical protein